MRAEGILRVILNERIIPGMKFSVIQDKYISFAAISDSKTIKKYLVKVNLINNQYIIIITFKKKNTYIYIYIIILIIFNKFIYINLVWFNNER